jgi:predicted GIY-YIG superfamily endonuclease
MQLSFQQNDLNFFGVVNFYIMETDNRIYNVSEFSSLAAKRYREHTRQKQKEYWMQRLVITLLRILHALIGMLRETTIKKARRVEKINVD